MPTPEQPTLPPGVPPPAPAGLVVRYDRSRTRTAFWAILGALGAAAVLLLLAVRSFAALDGTAPYIFTFMWMVLLVVVVALIGLVCYIRGTGAPLTEPWRISALGVQAQTPIGTVVLPWDAIAGVSLGTHGFNRRITIQPRPDAEPGRAGVEADPRTWQHLVKTGLYLGGPGISPEPEEILDAMRRCSGGRVLIR